MRKLVYLSMLMLCLVGCGKGDTSYIPSVAVNFSAPLTDPRLSKLGGIGGSTVITGYGVAGLIIYRYGTGTNDYVAYDRCSSYLPQNKCAVTIDATGLTATDPCSGSKFLLSDGSPVKAPATRSLKSYSVYVSNFTIFVSN
ncbi:hypothetical protein HH214_07750 [Mucilaginibacter robiniae]|uniref:Rieske domain-containing protein n=1 Tax=Mucilaginibacter robiniae TaxID=2728022 RepID=A0A7L5DYC1_9SPHI|nr:hypothetical protein [Mucilaginibacter robiniae]QJD95771.1 hypothetical protein HH214_07750 [Mucilaginibacter robiniae]